MSKDKFRSFKYNGKIYNIGFITTEACILPKIKVGFKLVIIYL